MVIYDHGGKDSSGHFVWKNVSSSKNVTKCPLTDPLDFGVIRINTSSLRLPPMTLFLTNFHQNKNNKQDFCLRVYA